MYNNCAWCGIDFNKVNPRKDGIFEYTSLWVEGSCICADCYNKFEHEKAQFARDYIESKRKGRR